MPAAQSQSVLIREGCQIVRMRRIHHETNQSATLFYWPENARPRQFRETLCRVARKLRVVFENCRASDSLDVINRCREPDRARDARRASLEPLRRFLKYAFFQGDAHDHFATAVPR